MLKNRKGAALPIALIAMFVLSLLGVALWQYSMSDTIQATRQENWMKAYYIARSAAEATGVWMMDDDNEGTSLLGKTSNPRAFGDGTYVVDVQEVSPTSAVIESTATVNGVSAKASLAMKRVAAFDSGEPIFNHAVYAQSRIRMNSASIDVFGTVAHHVDAHPVILHQNMNITGGGVIQTSIKYPPVLFPELSGPTLTNFTGSEISSDSRYNNIGEVNELVFRPNGGILKVRCRNFNVKRKVRVEGPGTVHLYVDQSFTVNNSGSEPGVFCEPQQFIVFLGSGGNANINCKVFNGYLYAPEASVLWNNGGQEWNGAIIAGHFESQGKRKIVYDYFEFPEEYKPIADDSIVFLTPFVIDYWLPNS